MTLGMTLDQARAIISGTLDTARKNSYAPLTVVVLDAGGHVVAVERQDGSSNKRFEIAHGKAHGAISLGLDSRALMTRAEQQPHFVAAVTHAVGALVPVPGGVLVTDANGSLLGAVGVSGDVSDNDEAAALAGVEAAGLSAQA